MIEFLKYKNWDQEIEILKILPKQKLFERFLSCRENMQNNYGNIDFILWSEALNEEISIRKCSKEFEEIIEKINSQNVVHIIY